MKRYTFSILAVFMVCQLAWATDLDHFKLKDGDRVVFYGDSITDQRLYTVIVEAYVATRYPHLHVSFVNSGWGGDTVYGGGGGPIDSRLKRDVFAYDPTVITLMLGMNDGGYKAETEANDEKYFTGYRHIVESIRSTLPQARILAIKPSPFDNVAHEPAFPVDAGFQYNDVMRSFGEWIASYASQTGLDVADLNFGMVKMLTQAHEVDPANAKQIIPDHVHPSFAGHLVMAEELLKAWGARSLVSAVTIDATHRSPTIVSTQFATLSALSNDSAIAWTELDDALPLPFKQWQDNWGAGPVDLVIKSSDVTRALNQQLLTVKGLHAGTYSLEIDGTSIGAFNNDQFSQGINLAILKTPATDQAMKVYQLANSHEEIHFDQWRNVDLPLNDYSMPQAQSAIDSLKLLDDAIAKKMHEIAQPVPHKFRIVPLS